MKNNFILYKIYYDEGLVYFGRTEQQLIDRIRKHVMKDPGVKPIDIELIKKIEFAKLKSEADMYLYEIYYICKYKPPINRDDKPVDDLTITLPELEFEEWDCDIWEKWKTEIIEKKKAKIDELKEDEKLEYEWSARSYEALRKKRNNEISEDEFDEIIKEIEKEKIKRKFEKNQISFEEYCDQLGLNKL